MGISRPPTFSSSALMAVTFLALSLLGNAADVVRRAFLSAGMLADDQGQMIAQLRKNAKTYTDLGMINGFAPLLYTVTENGTFAVQYAKPIAINSTLAVRGDTGLPVYPYLYCDDSASSTNCGREGVVAVLNGDPNGFYDASVKEAKLYGWKGYQVDLEAMTGSGDDYVTFCDQWGVKLHAAGLELLVWSSSGTPNPGKLAASPNVDVVIDMNTYGAQYSPDAFIAAMQGWTAQVGAAKSGVGVLTYSSAQFSADAAKKVCAAASAEGGPALINFWASEIEPAWGCLCSYIGAKCPGSSSEQVELVV